MHITTDANRTNVISHLGWPLKVWIGREDHCTLHGYEDDLADAAEILRSEGYTVSDIEDDE